MGMSVYVHGELSAIIVIDHVLYDLVPYGEIVRLAANALHCDTTKQAVAIVFHPKLAMTAMAARTRTRKSTRESLY